jgi:phage terminase large subunit-like protein
MLRDGAQKQGSTAPLVRGLGWAMLALLLGMLACTPLDSSPAPPGGLAVTGRLAGTGYDSQPWWVVVTAGVEPFYRGEILAAQRVEAEGPYRIEVAQAPELAMVWLVHDRDHDGPDGDDPHRASTLTPLPIPTDGLLRADHSNALEQFQDHEAPREWLSAQLDPAAGTLYYGVWLLGLLLVGVSAARRTGAARPAPRRPGPTRRRRRAVQQLWIALTAIVLVGAALRLLVLQANGCDAVGLTSKPYLMHAFPGPGTMSLMEILRNPFELLPRQPLPFLALMQLLGSFMPPGACGLKLVLAVACLPTMLASFGVGRFLGGTRTGLLAAGLAACTPMAVYFGAALSPHGMHLLLVSLSLLLLLRSLLQDRPISRALWAGVSILGALVFPIHAVVLSGQVLVLLLLVWRRDASLRPAAASCLRWAWPALAITTAPLVTQLGLGRRLFSAEGMRIGYYAFHEQPPHDAWYEAIELIAGLPPGGVLAAPVALILLALGLRAAWRRAPEATLLVALPGATLLAALLFLSWLETRITGGLGWYRGHWAVGVLAITAPLTACSIEVLLDAARAAWRGTGSARVATPLLATLALAPLAWCLYADLQLQRNPGLPDTEGAVQEISGLIRQGDSMLAVSSLPHMGLMKQQVASALEERPSPRPRLAGPSEHPLVPMELALQSRAIVRVWAFDYRESRFERPKIDDRRIRTWRHAWMSEHFEPVQRWSFRNLDLVLYEREPPRDELEQGATQTFETAWDFFRFRPNWELATAVRQVDRRFPLQLTVPLMAALDGPFELAVEVDPPSMAGCLVGSVNGCRLTPMGAEPWPARTEACRAEDRLEIELVFAAHCRDRASVSAVRFTSAPPAPRGGELPPSSTP